MREHKQIAQPIEVVEIQIPKRIEEVPQPEQWVQEEEKHRNQRIEWEHPQEKIQRLVPGFDLKRLVL